MQSTINSKAKTEDKYKVNSTNKWKWMDFHIKLRRITNTKQLKIYLHGHFWNPKTPNNAHPKNWYLASNKSGFITSHRHQPQNNITKFP